MWKYSQQIKNENINEGNKGYQKKFLKNNN